MASSDPEFLNGIGEAQFEVFRTDVQRLGKHCRVFDPFERRASLGRFERMYSGWGSTAEFLTRLRGEPVWGVSSGCTAAGEALQSF